MAKSDGLTDLQLAFNCPAQWESMVGDEQSRHCNLCKRNVYNISSMTRQEAIDFLEAKGEKVCVRYFKRRDGTILTAPCGKAKRGFFSLKMKIATACAGVAFFGFPIFMPVYAGARKLPPKAEFKRYSKRLTEVRQQIAESKDKDEKEMLQDMMRMYRDRMSRAYRAMSPKDLEELANQSGD